MEYGWLVIAPPIIVLLAAFFTHRLNSSLLLGLLSAAFIASHGKVWTTLQHTLSTLATTLADPENLAMYAFLVLISILIVLLEHTGGPIAFGKALTARLQNARSAEISSMIMSMCLFIDDYLSTLTTGYVMRPITDKFHIARVKLAFLIHTLSGPFVILIPLSSWVAMIMTNLDQAGVSAVPSATTLVVVDPFALYVQTIPFIFYSLIMLVSLFFIVYWGISFGPMKRQEEIARATHNLFGGKAPLPSSSIQEPPSHSIIDFILPLTTLIILVVAGLLYAGNFWLFGGTASFVQALQQEKRTALILCTASLITLCITMCRAVLKKQIRMRNIFSISYDGIMLIKGAILMLILVTSLGYILKNDLHTGEFLAHTCVGALPVWLLPSMFFIVSSIVSIMIGSSWGTIALLVPIAMPMLVTLSGFTLVTDVTTLPLMLPLLGAIFSGAVCGDHISPISQTTVLAATSSGSYAVDHVRTQLPYAIPAVICSTLAFAMIGYFSTYPLLITWIATFFLSALLACLILYGCHRYAHRKQNSLN